MATAAPAPPAPNAARPPTSKWRRRVWFLVGAVVILAVGAATYLGESSGRNHPTAPKAFCRATSRYEKELDRQAGRAKRNLARQLPLVEQIAVTAPGKIQADAQTFADAMQRVQTDPSVKDDPRVKRAVDNVNRYASQGCGVFARNGI